ncbi:MAG: hypothetical protein Q7K39_04250 [Candidatus Magasanikbacteria bacterium]|nr:hypothetical protein [Candidatus Magasanikbacteria bacterium]
MNEKLSRFLRRAEGLLFGEIIDTPEKLAAHIRTEAQTIKRTLPYWPEKHRPRLCSELNLSEEPLINPMAAQIENPDLRKRAMADGEVKLSLKIILKTLDTYTTDDRHYQTIRIREIRNRFNQLYRQSELTVLPNILEQLAKEIEGTKTP